MPYTPPNGFSTGTNIALGLGSAVLFGVAVTNCIVYSGGTSGANGTNGGCLRSGNTVTTNIDTTCSWIMLILNIIFAIITFIFMIMFFWEAFRVNRANRSAEYVEIDRPPSLDRYPPHQSDYGQPNPKYEVREVREVTQPVFVPQAVPVALPVGNSQQYFVEQPAYSRVSSTTVSSRSR